MDAMDALRDKFLDRCRDQLVILRERDHPAFHATVHGLAGAAGLFGYDEISRLARIVDEAASDGRQAEEATSALIAAVEGATGAV